MLRLCALSITALTAFPATSNAQAFGIILGRNISEYIQTGTAGNIRLVSAPAPVSHYFAYGVETSTTGQICVAAGIARLETDTRAALANYARLEAALSARYGTKPVRKPMAGRPGSFSTSWARFERAQLAPLTVVVELQYTLGTRGVQIMETHYWDHAPACLKR